MTFFTTRRKVVAGGLAAAIVLAGGVGAYAYWSSSGGTGTGNASTGLQTTSLVIAQTAAPTNLAPGIAAGAITGTIQNTGTNNALVHSVTVSIASVTMASGHPAGTCLASDYTLTGAIMVLDADLVPNATPTPFNGATLGFHDTGLNQDSCQGATVNLAYATN
jgi:hypothetical protein